MKPGIQRLSSTGATGMSYTGRPRAAGLRMLGMWSRASHTLAEALPRKMLKCVASQGATPSASSLCCRSFTTNAICNLAGPRGLGLVRGWFERSEQAQVKKHTRQAGLVLVKLQAEHCPNPFRR